MEVENRWGNTKYLLGHLVPGKDPIYRGITACKSYSDVCKLLGLQLMDLAQATDMKLDIDPELNSAGKRTQKKQLALEINGGIKRKRSAELLDAVPRDIEMEHTALALSV
jgi:tRNA-dihydrouridine synthase 2